ncbi:MAG: methylmalonyl-CoA epimerase [Chloroflexota bacterium]|nr:MAG: methylmalonyl-CoA epimerase [Chloroflexota bacterium]
MIKGLHHASFAVSNLARSIAFYESLGCEVLWQEDKEGERFSATVGIPEARGKVAMLRIGDNRAELFQYINPTGRPHDRRNCDIGAGHWCFSVTDINEHYEALLAKGVKFNSPPRTIESGALKGCRAVYFSDPDGITLELFQEAD